MVHLVCIMSSRHMKFLFNECHVSLVSIAGTGFSFLICVYFCALCTDKLERV